MTPYPIAFAPILMPKVWGGDRLRRFGKMVDAEPIGESWELADLARTSTSGGGGGEARSVIVNGPLAGATLHHAIEQWSDAMIAPGKLAPASCFPLLVKFLDARENLSVQVHPSPAYAAAHDDAHLKTECWFILDAEPGARIYKGVKSEVTREQFEDDIRTGELVDDLVGVEARPGDMHLLPSGTVHALGAGVLVAEVQTPSDTTYRVYDWGRTDREIHVQQALASMTLDPAPEATRLRPGATRGELCTTPFFVVEGIHVAGVHALDVDGCCVVMVIDGDAVLESRGCEPLSLPMGTTVLVPSVCAPAAALVGDNASVLCISL